MDPLVVTRAGGVVTLTINRPERANAVTSEMWADITAVFRQVAASPGDRVLVVTGAGDAFCSGADLSSLSDTSSPVAPLTTMRRVGEAAAALVRLPKPTIARVNGVAAGAGANLALACDLVVASEAARFSQIFSKRGLSPDFAGSWLLPRLVGLQRAKELVFFGDMVSARDGAALGFVTKVVAAEDLDAAVADWAQRLAAGPPLALSMAKSLLNDSFASSVEQAVDAEAMAQSYNLTSRDAREALAAYLDKRPPEYRGR